LALPYYSARAQCLRLSERFFVHAAACPGPGSTQVLLRRRRTGSAVLDHGNALRQGPSSQLLMLLYRHHHHHHHHDSISIVPKAKQKQSKDV